ncbi:1-acyl-sn-glycerol-3-phosphate acyltransferase [Actinomyces sp. 594]|uniref:lysophospholipid acyltransferase family protein n=1 Tax=Actinomyces sp. 594 TaxID=2057793 RepID=UPI001C5A2F1C|nr:lysophospholipid acyltransferase family protein [Actinomyces sp. 594]MBW3068290.1 1-acyl-sn-glycerol-3-phosphate acyltransferase [Actinomyces sp. 594]
MTPFYRFAARGAIIPFLKAVSKQHVTGTENIPREGGFIAVANHLSNLDPLTAMRALVDEDVPIYSLAKSQLFEIPVLGHVFRAGGQIPVYRDSAKAGNSLVEAERRLGEGDPIMIFPEGTLSRDPLQWPMTGKTGAARLAMRTGVPVLPMGQWGAQDVLGAYGSGFRPFPRKDVDVLIGKPFDLSEFGEDTSDHAAVRGATAEIMRRITELVEQLRGEKAPRPFDMKYDGDPGKGNIGVRRPDPPTTSDDVRPSRTGTPPGGPGGNENGDEPETASEQQP